jgi:hypothetical protein
MVEIGHKLFSILAKDERMGKSGKSKKMGKGTGASLAADYSRVPEGILCGNRCPIHPKEEAARSSRVSRDAATSRTGERMFFCPSCREWRELPELVRAALGPAATLEMAVRESFHPDIPEPILVQEIRWRRRREEFMMQWDVAQYGAAALRRSGVGLPYGDWGVFDRVRFSEEFPGMLPSVHPSRLGMTRQGAAFLVRLLRDEFLRPAALEAHQQHSCRLIYLQAVRFNPDGAPGFEASFPPDPQLDRNRSEIVLADDGETAGRLLLGVSSWRESSPPVGLIRRMTAPAAWSARRYTLVTRNSISSASSATAASCLRSGGAEVRMVLNPPDGALEREETFRAMERPVADQPSVNPQTRELRHRGSAYRRTAGAYWRDGEPISNFTLRPLRAVQRADGSLRHELKLCLQGQADEPVFSISSKDFHRADALYLAAWEQAIRAALPPPILADPAHKKLLPSLVLAAEPPAPLFHERAAVIDELLAASPPARWQRGRRLIDEDYFQRSGAGIDPDALSRALRDLHGPAFGWVRTGKHKLNRAIRIP